MTIEELKEMLEKVEDKNQRLDKIIDVDNIEDIIEEISPYFSSLDDEDIEPKLATVNQTINAIDKYLASFGQEYSIKDCLKIRHLIEIAEEVFFPKIDIDAWEIPMDWLEKKFADNPTAQIFFKTVFDYVSYRSRFGAVLDLLYDAYNRGCNYSQEEYDKYVQDLIVQEKRKRLTRKVLFNTGDLSDKDFE